MGWDRCLWWCGEASTLAWEKLVSCKGIEYVEFYPELKNLM
jgi:hypothetical protein